MKKIIVVITILIFMATICYGFEAKELIRKLDTTEKETAKKELLENRSKAIPEMIKALKDENVTIRKEVVKLMGRIEDKKVVESLKEVSKNDEQYSVRVAAALSVRGLTEENIKASSVGASGVKEFMEESMNDLREVAKTAKGDGAPFQMLGILDTMKTVDKEAVPYLSKIINNKNEDVGVRVVALQSIKEIGTTENNSHLRDILADENEDVNIRCLAASTITTNKDPQATGLLINIVSDKTESPRLRQKAIQCLRIFRENSAIQVLEECLKDKDNVIRSLAAYALKEITGNEYEYKRNLP